jgi:hypothetical protein
MGWLGFCLGCWAGYVYAHYAIASECDRLGGFFVGKRTYLCQRKEENHGS